MPIFLQTPKKQGVLQKSSFHPVSGNQAGHPKVPAKGRIPKRRFQEIHFLCRRLLFFAERHGFHIPLRAVQGMRNNIRPLRGIHLQVQFIFVYSILYKPCIFKAYRLLNVQTLCIFPCFCPYEPKQGKFFILRRLPYPAVLRKYASLPL